MEENLRKSQANNDWLKEEHEKLLQDKDKIRRMAETEIKRLKEEFRQQKDREDRMHSQINRHLKKKTDDFEKLYREHKQTEADYKRLGLEFDRQQEKLKEFWTELQ